MFNIIGSLKTKTFGSVANVVVGCDWNYTVSLGGCDFRFNGSSDFDYNPDSPFIEYVNLTQETVIGWVQSTISQGELDFYSEKAQEHLDAFNENGEVPRLTDVWAEYTIEQNQDTPWVTEEETND